MQRALVGLGLAVLMAGCASEWKIHGGPQECVEMCRSWGMDLSGMVGVGNQDSTGGGATACVCQVHRAGPPPASSSSTSGGEVGAIGTATSTAAVVVALQEAQQRQQQQHTMH